MYLDICVGTMPRPEKMWCRSGDWYGMQCGVLEFVTLWHETKANSDHETSMRREDGKLCQSQYGTRQVDCAIVMVVC